MKKKNIIVFLVVVVLLIVGFGESQKHGCYSGISRRTYGSHRPALPVGRGGYVTNGECLSSLVRKGCSINTCQRATG